jgi:hypothetical protein
VDSTITGPTSTGRTFPAPQGNSRYKKLFAEPSDHAIGRLGAGWAPRSITPTTVRPAAGDDSWPWTGRRLAHVPLVMEAVRVPRLGGGRARARPYAVLGDKAYSSRGNGSLLSGRGIKAAGILPVGDFGVTRHAEQGKFGRPQCRVRGEPRLELLFVGIVQH